MKEHITDKIKESRANQIKWISESISNNIDNGRKIWEVKRKVKRKDETPEFIINSKGRKIENSEEILKEYKKCYERLLQTRPPENLQEEKIEQDVNIKFQKIVDDEHNVERKKIAQLEVKKAILKMKSNKSGDRSRWKSEWLKEGGDEMIENLTAIFNRVEEEGQIPLQWRETKIKSLYKGGGSKEKIQESQRGIFITNIVSKAYEIVKKIQSEAIQSNISNMQTAGKKNRSTMDSIIIINAIIEKQR